MIGFISLVLAGIIVCILFNLLRPSNHELNFYAIIMTTIVVPILWHLIGYFIEGPKVLMWILVSLPVSAVISFLTAVVTTFVFYSISNKIQKRNKEAVRKE